jgi:hypothetical protein
VATAGRARTVRPVRPATTSQGRGSPSAGPLLCAAAAVRTARHAGAAPHRDAVLHGTQPTVVVATGRGEQRGGTRVMVCTMRYIKAAAGRRCAPCGQRRGHLGGAGGHLRRNHPLRLGIGRLGLVARGGGLLAGLGALGVRQVAGQHLATVLNATAVRRRVCVTRYLGVREVADHRDAHGLLQLCARARATRVKQLLEQAARRRRACSAGS